MSFFPVDRGIFTSSVWLTGTPEEKVLWLWLLGNRDDDGVVRHRELAIAYGTGLPRPVVEAGLLKFSGPDEDSRTRDNDGRRIDRTPDGFVRILNHELYYSKDYSTPRWRAWKERKGLRGSETVGQQSAALENVGPTKDKDKDKDIYTDTPPTPPGESGGGPPRKGNGAATARELAALETDPALLDIGDAWVQAFKRPRRELGVLRAARTALAGGYAADAMKLVVRVAALAREAPERFPDRGSIRWAVEHGKAGDPGYLLRPATLDRLIPEAEAWDRA